MRASALTDMPSAVLVTGHYLQSHRRAGFHWIADALHRAGWRVTVMTAPMSWLSWLRRDHRMEYPVRTEANRLVEVEPNLLSFVWWTTWHPASLRIGLLDRLAEKLYARYHAFPLGAIENEVRDADLVLFESTPALALFERMRGLNASARFVYRVSDDIALLGLHPMIQRLESRIAPEFDRVSSPTSSLHEKFAHLPHARLDPHGVPAHLLDVSRPSPYVGDAAKLVFVGVSRFDHRFLESAVNAPTDAEYHVIGPIDGLLEHPRVVAHGELPFADTVPYLQHADAGLHTLAWEPGGSVFADSLKVQQYSWCRLPVIAPEFLRSSRANLVCYQPDDDSTVGTAIARALALPRSDAWRDGVCSWDDVACRLAGIHAGIHAGTRAGSAEASPAPNHREKAAP